MFKKNMIAQRFSWAAQRYEAVTPVQQQSAVALFDLLPDVAPLSAKPVLLDVGMGSGRLFGLTRRRLGVNWQLQGIDFAPQMLAETQRRWPEAQLFCCDAEAYHYPAEHYNLVLSNFALQWCNAPVLLLQRLYQTLQPGGVLAAALPVRGSLKKLSELVTALCGENLPLYPLPLADDFAVLPGLLQSISDSADEPQLELRQQVFYSGYDSVLEALKAIQQAGAATPGCDETAGQNDAQLSFRAWKQLQRHTGRVELEYQVLFIVLCKALAR